jgi:hypothetical protein
MNTLLPKQEKEENVHATNEPSAVQEIGAAGRI